MSAITATAIFAIFALTLATAPASAHPFPHFHHGHGFWGGPGLAFGLVGAAIATGIAAESYCVRYVPVYDAWGNHIGNRAVNAC